MWPPHDQVSTGPTIDAGAAAFATNGAIFLSIFQCRHRFHGVFRYQWATSVEADHLDCFPSSRPIFWGQPRTLSWPLSPPVTLPPLMAISPLYGNFLPNSGRTLSITTIITSSFTSTIDHDRRQPPPCRYWCFSATSTLNHIGPVRPCPHSPNRAYVCQCVPVSVSIGPHSFVTWLGWLSYLARPKARLSWVDLVWLGQLAQVDLVCLF